MNLEWLLNVSLHIQGMHILLFVAGLQGLTTSFIYNCTELACFLKSGVTDYVGTLHTNRKIPPMKDNN